MKKQKYQVLLRGEGWVVRRDDGLYKYRLEGDLSWTDANVVNGSLPLSQEDVAVLFKCQGLEWRYE